METPRFIKQKVCKERHDYCAIRSCGSSSKQQPELAFHKFPAKNKTKVLVKNAFGVEESLDIFKAWSKAVRNIGETKGLKICSLHFKKSDYYFPDIECKRRKLKPNAVPSLCLPQKQSSAYQKQLEKERKARHDNRNHVSVSPPVFPICNLTNSIHTPNQSEVPNDLSADRSEKIYKKDAADLLDLISQDNDQEVSQENLSNVMDGEKSSNQSKTFVNQNVQVDSYNLTSFISTDEELSTVTGIESFKILNVIVKIVMQNFGENYESDKCHLKTRDRIILTYAKLKLNTTYAFLGIVFRCSPQTCSRIFKTTIQILSKCLKFAIRWPNRDEIARNLPECFKDFEDTRVVLDCTEIFIQQPKEVCCQIVTYSQYKSHVTLKIMTGVTPAGDISYVSKIYGGRSSDNAIFQQSDLLNLLEPGDALMVDRGFLIDTACEENKLKLIRPPFLKQRNQFTAKEATLNAKVAAARVHVERSNQRIKNFQITNLMSSTLIPLIDDIFLVICATVNLSAPIIGDKNFMKSDIEEDPHDVSCNCDQLRIHVTRDSVPVLKDISCEQNEVNEYLNNSASDESQATLENIH